MKTADKRLLIFFVLWGLLFLLPPTVGYAEPETVFVVDSFADEADQTLDGICQTASGACTLRAAIQEANYSGGTSDTISLPAGTYQISIPGTGENAAATGDLDISTTMIIGSAGDGTVIIDGNQLDRVFHVTASGSATFQNLTIRNGRAPANEPNFDGGGGILIEGGPVNLQNSIIENNRSLDSVQNQSYGGGIETYGSLTVINTLFQGNTANWGGAIFVNSGASLSIRNSLIYNNTASGTNNEGGGLMNSGTATIQNVTFSQNNSDDGGAIYNSSAMSLNNVTIAYNQSGLSNTGIYLNIKNTILAHNTAGNCLSGHILNSQGNNIDSLESCGFSDGINDKPTDLSNTNPLLILPLADNGGTTHTFALELGSPAIDAGADCLEVDQRSVPRPIDGNSDGVAVCDIGAFEAYARLFLPLILR